VDNGSTDGSPSVAIDYGVRVVHARPTGFGAAANAGLLAARTDVVCFLDADGSLDPAELPTVTAPVENGAADLVLGRRRAATASAFPWHARLGNAVVTWRLRRAMGVPVRDLGPMRAGRRLALLELDLRDQRFGYPLEMVVRAARAGLRVTEVDVRYTPRIGGRSKVTGSVRGTARAIRDMAEVLAR
jgi:glycosyltransferase involved in cell wall biosynthesis